MKFWQHSIDKPMWGENRFEIHSMTNFPSDSACGLVNILMEYFLGNFDGELLLIWLFWQMNDQRGSWVPNKWFISTLQAADTKKCYQIRRMEISRYENLIKTPRERMHSIDRQGLGLADKIIFPIYICYRHLALQMPTSVVSRKLWPDKATKLLHNNSKMFLSLDDNGHKFMQL